MKDIPESLVRADPESADTGARRLLGAALVLCLAGEVGLALSLGSAAAESRSLALLLVLPVLAGLLLWAFGMWQRVQARWRVLEAEMAEHIRARRAAETANLAKSRYLANISHEIRSPLNAIYGYAQLVERNDGAGAVEASVVIRRCAEHITSLVEALLDISQVEAGVIRVKPEPVRFDQFIEQIVRMVRPSATARGLDFRLETQGRMPAVVRMDQSRLRQVLLNLLNNAVKYTEKGSVTLFVRYAAQMATFEVRDTGPGIRSADQQTIFEPFERGGDHKARAQPGAGLGLAIARAIVGILGGKLELASTSPEGTCFRLTMMLGEVSTPTAVAQQGKRLRVAGYSGPRRSILVCDDDEAQRQFLSELLGNLGFVVQTAPNGEVAAELVEGGRRFDMAILDINLPGISGWEVASRLRAVEGEDIRILMLSANAHEFYRPQTTSPVHDQFLVKPVEFDALIETVGTLLDLTWGVEAEKKPEKRAPAFFSTLPAGETAKEAAGQPEGAAASVPEAPEPVPDPLLVPTAPEPATRIRELLRIGYIRGIEREIHQLAEVPATAELADKLYACLDRFDLPGMARIVEEC